MLPSLHMLPLGSPALHEETGEEIERLLCDIGEQLRLAKLVDLGDDTGAKAGKGKAPAATPYDKSVVKGDPIPKVLKEFAEEKWDAPTYKGEVVKTVKHQITNSTEIERAWLRKEYGGNWSSADKELKAKMQKQARTVLSFEIAPKIISAIETEEADAILHFNAQHLTPAGAPKLDWSADVYPALQSKYPPPLDWRKDASGKWLDQPGKDARANEVKAELRIAKMATLEKLRVNYVEERVIARIAKTVEDLNYPDTTLKRKARALLRHWFNRKGKDGVNRVWNKPGEDKEEDASASTKKKVAMDVPADMHKKRLTWAKTRVGYAGYDPTNPPSPPSDLYLPLDVRPLPDSYLPDGVENVSDAGGQWLWSHMRALETMDIENKVDYTGKFVDKDASAQYWDPAFRVKQKAMLVDAYQEFVESVDAMSEIPLAKNIAYSYTVGSGRFNKYLLWPSDSVGGDPTKIPKSGKGVGGVGGNVGVGQIGPPDALHRLYKLINRCPRLPENAVFLRAVNSKAGLPHNLGKATLTTPVVGRGYLNVSFMSTSSATPDQYTAGVLSTFYDHNGPDGGCCMYAITCPKNSPVLPLVLGSDLSAYADEQEVVLPPGLVLIYQGEKRMQVGQKTPIVHFYQVERPPPLPGATPKGLGVPPVFPAGAGTS